MFNAISLPSLSQMRRAVGDNLPVPEFQKRDRLPSWEYVTEERLFGERRLLFRCAEGGLMWVHVDDRNQAYDATVIDDEEAREVWVKHLLDFTPEEDAKLAATLQAGESLADALEAALGTDRVSKSFFLPASTASDGTDVRTFVADDGGVIRAYTAGTDSIVRTEIIRGADAWKLLQPFVDP